MYSILTAELGARFASIALGHVTQEFPHKPDIVLSGLQELRAPSDLHPIFFGSFDWHSCVHSYWLLARLLRFFPDGPHAGATRSLFDRQLVPAKVAAECAYLETPLSRGFERPYGWAWLLKLSSELAELPDRRWHHALAPLAAAFRRRFEDFLPIAPYPVRVGTHYNTAFALRMAADYAEGAKDAGFSGLLLQTAERWYGDDMGCPAWGEPSGDDFLSPALIEAECMRSLLPTDRFLPWFDRFLPHLDKRLPHALFRPALVTDRSDGKIAHLDGLNLSRAWCLRALSRSQNQNDGLMQTMLEAADRHLAAGMPHIDDDYMGRHWLGTFALLALQA